MLKAPTAYFFAAAVDIISLLVTSILSPHSVLLLLELIIWRDDLLVAVVSATCFEC